MWPAEAAGRVELEHEFVGDLGGDDHYGYEHLRFDADQRGFRAANCRVRLCPRS